VDGDNTEQLPAGNLQRPAVQPARPLHGAETDKSSGLRVNIIRLDVDVEARGVVHSLDGGHQARDCVWQGGELLLTGNRHGGDTESSGPKTR